MIINSCLDLSNTRNALKQISDFLKTVRSVKEIEDNLMNRENLIRVKTYKSMIQEIGIEHPLQAKVLLKRFFELKTNDQIALETGYGVRQVQRYVKEGIEMLEDLLKDDTQSSAGMGA